MNKVISGFCPTQNKSYSIKVSVINTGTLNNPNQYEYGLIDCEYAGFNDCNLARNNQCPLRNSLK